jgi:hypothetical protein
LVRGEFHHASPLRGILAGLVAAASAAVTVEVVTPGPAAASTHPGSVAALDTVPRSAPRLFERRVLFSTEYLGRVLASAQRSGVAEIAIELLPPDERGRAAAYARKYDIPPALAL